LHVSYSSFLLTLPLFAAPGDPPVTLTDDPASFTLANARISARIDKRTGFFSLKQNDLTVIDRGYWSQVGRSSAGDIAQFPPARTSSILLNPTTNNGDRATVSIRFTYDPKTRPTALPCDVEFRYTLARTDTGLYAMAIWHHKPGYPSFSVAEARMALKLPEIFDYLAIDARRRFPMPSGRDWDAAEPLNLKEARRIKTGPLVGKAEHKYDYSALLDDNRAYGWIATKQHTGVWMINPSIEYLAGGPTKVELTGHLDVNPGGAPTLLNMWHGSHYGGSSLSVGQDEAWSKTIGPFLLHVNHDDAADPDALWRDALKRAKSEQAAWPYAWAADPESYPSHEQRATVTGKLTITDPQQPNLKPRNLHVGLAAAPYSVPGRGANSTVDWQHDSKHYQFWTIAKPDGSFAIPAVRPGSYTLYAFAENVLGEFSQPDIVIAGGDNTDLGSLTWTPTRFGRQLWEIGVPDRTAEEFRHGDDYWHWGLYNLYAKEFPHDVDFTIGQSQERTDWNYAQPTRVEGRPAGPTTWTIRFTLDQAPPSTAKATLRLAICGSRGRSGIAVAVNAQPAGNTGPLPDTGVLHRDGIRGYWFERDVTFAGSLLKQGANTLTLTISGTSWVDGVLYDYLRLELDDGK
jgi:rhamnogalacturonan endolyase